MLIYLIIHIILGLCGYLMYLSNKNTRPKKIHYLVCALLTHSFFGPIGFLYGYFCFSGRKN